MHITPGSRLGAYEVVAKLAEGGMGEVYLARDAKLDRDVAIKVLPAAVSDDADRIARFEREAKAVAALSHPNILAIHDFGVDHGTAYAVMELLRGTTLRERLQDGALPVRKAVDIAVQIAHGLGAAHEKGIVHRDLKPENIFLLENGQVKVLDFGLAKAAAAGPGARAESDTVAATSPGTVMGTAGYMAPEQVRGEQVDARTDLFALGAVIYEMLSGQRAFRRDTGAETMTAVLKDDPPDLLEARADLPPALDRIVRHCLEKSPQERFQTARDVAFALEALSGSGSTRSQAALPSVTRPRRRGALVLAGVVLAALAGATAAGYWLASRTPHTAAAGGPAAVFSFDAGFTFPPLLSLSPDGRTVAYNSPNLSSGALGALWLHRLDGSPAPAGFPTSSGDVPLVWSGDSRRLLVYVSGKIVDVDATTGTRRTIAAVPTLYGAAWLSDGGVLVGAGRSIARIPGGGGALVDVLKPDPGRNEGFAWPQPFGDGTRLLYAARVAAPGTETEWRIGPLSGAGKRASDPVILKGASGVVLVEPDAVFYVRGSILFVQRIDLNGQALVGEPVQLATEVYENPGTARAPLGASSAGVVAFRKEQFPSQLFYWVDRSGRRLSEFPKRNTFTNFDLSPDNGRVAVTVRRRPYNLGSQLWVLDLARGVATDVSVPDGNHSDALWAPDGTRLAFRIGGRVVIRPADGGAETTVLNRLGYPESWSPDGRYIALGVPEDGDYQLWTLDLRNGNETAPLVTGAASLDEPRFSPNGGWVVYNASEGGRAPEVYAVPFPPTGQRYQLSPQGGTQPRWRRDGQELFYLAPDGTLMAVRIPGSDVRKAGRPEPLFQTGLEVSSAFDQFAPSADGQRFLIRHPEGVKGDRAPVHVIVNWRTLLDAGSAR